MPIPQVYRVDPRDLENNIGIGVSLPFNGTSIFNQTFSTKDQIKSNLINLLLTYKGEREFNPEFGADLPRLLFDPLDEKLYKQIQNTILTSVATYIPEIILTDIEITPEADQNILYITISYQIKLSGSKDTLNLQLQ